MLTLTRAAKFKRDGSFVVIFAEQSKQLAHYDIDLGQLRGLYKQAQERQARVQFGIIFPPTID